MARDGAYKKVCSDCGTIFYTGNKRDRQCVNCRPRCSVEGCDSLITPHSRGMCGVHAARMWRDLPIDQRLRHWQTGPCSVDGCEEAAVKRGYCELHYSRIRRTGEPGSATTTQKPRGVPCEVQGCVRLASANGLCSMHSSRLRATGKLGQAEPLIAPSGSGHLLKKGYRIIHVAGRRILEHRYVMEQKLGRPLTADETVHHVRDETPEDKANNDPTNLELWSSRHPSGQRAEDKVAFIIEMAKRYPTYLAAQGFRMMPLESAEATHALLGTPSFNDFDAAAVLRRWMNA
jgi:hypothetical protein